MKTTEREATGHGARRVGELSGTVLRPPELEQEFRLAHLRDDGRDAAVVIGFLTLLSAVFVVNDLTWALPAGRLVEHSVARAIYTASGLMVVAVGLRTTRPAWLDASIVANGLVGSAFTFPLQWARAWASGSRSANRSSRPTAGRSPRRARRAAAPA